MIGWAPEKAGMTPAETSGAPLLARLGAERPRGAPLMALWIAVVVAEALALRPVLLDREAPVEGIDVVFSLVGGSFAACGLIAWRRRPDSRSGALMTATGFAFFVPVLLGQVDAALAATIGSLLSDLWAVFFAALLLTYLEGGRLRSGVDRLLVAAFALPALVLQLM